MVNADAILHAPPSCFPSAGGRPKGYLAKASVYILGQLQKSVVWFVGKQRGITGLRLLNQTTRLTFLCRIP
jgi:hypothetical protein